MSKLSKFLKTPHLFFLDAILNRVANTKNNTRAKTVNLVDGVNTFVFGFSPWKGYIERWFPQRKLCFLPKDIKQYELEEILPYILKAEDPQIFIWGFKVNPIVLDFASNHNVTCVFVEDGFIRSVSLGATKALPLSLTFDSKTPYFNSREESDLEVLLNTYDFQSQPELITRSRRMIDSLIHSGISKYNHAKTVDIEEVYGIKTKKRILVVGQVEDDASIIYGCDRDMTNNDLVRIAAAENKDAQIIYKPHPDVLNKHRKKLSNPDDVRHLCLILELDIPLSQAFETVDHVYTMTSLAGFEALIRGIKVTALGCPFYSGWGVTDDRQPNARRQRLLSVDEVFAASYILYPKYFDPIYNKPLTPEQAVSRLQGMLGLSDANVCSTPDQGEHKLVESRFSCLIGGNLVKALALSGFGENKLQAWMVYAAYRTGLYQTVINAQILENVFEVLLARIVSYSAMGFSAEALTLLENPLVSRLTPEQRVELAKAITPYLPKQALLLIDAVAAPLGLRVALLLNLGHTEEADALLTRGFTARITDPQLFLLAANRLSESTGDKLIAINHFLSSFSLKPVSITRPDDPLSVTNLSIECGLKSVDGPLVSILVTAFNLESRIEQALESLLVQSWRNLEIIVVDDASTDQTSDRVKVLVQRDARVSLIRLTQNVGTYVAKLTAFRQARGEFVLCHDGDDWSHPERVFRQMRPLLDCPEVVATTSKLVRMTDDGCLFARQLYPLMRLNPSSPLFRRDLIAQSAGLWDCVRTGADSEFLARLKLVFGRKAVRPVNLPLCFGAHRNDSLVASSETGYGNGGVAPERLAYWEAWTHWHIDCLRQGRKPCLPAYNHDRVFAVPDCLRVPQVDIDRACHDSFLERVHHP